MTSEPDLMANRSFRQTHYSCHPYRTRVHVAIAVFRVICSPRPLGASWGGRAVANRHYGEKTDDESGDSPSLSLAPPNDLSSARNRRRTPSHYLLTGLQPRSSRRAYT